MKANILLFLFFSLLFLQITPAQNVEPQFSELRGFEDSQSNTHLFYRIYQRNGNQVEFTERNDIYRLNTVTLEDTFFLEDGGQSGVYINYFRNVDDYDFWSVDSLQYVYCLTICATECSPFIAKSDTTEFLYGGNFGAAMNISIGFNSDIIYCGLRQFTQGNSIKSLDGGYTWQALSEELIFCSLSPFDDDISFYLNENGSLFKSINGGTSFYEIDSTGAHIFQEDFEFHFDSDQSHIYTTYYDHPSYYLSISNNFGEPNSWLIKRSSNSHLSVSNNPSQTGEIYLAEGETIYKSTDFGDTFEAFNNLDDDIIDIYKKPDSDKLYAATKYRIYEVTANSVSILKQLTDPTEKYKWFPLEVGNTWVYDSYWIVYDPGFPPTYQYAGTKYMEVVTDTIIENNSYFIVESDILSQQVFEPKMFLRVDSTSGIIYKYWESLNDEFPFHDLDAEVGDTIYNPENPGQPFYILQNEEPIEFFGTNTFIREYSENLPCNCMHSLVQEYGLTYAVFEEFGGSEDNLKGAVIGGVVYGDTSFVVSVDEETEQLPTEFALHQNYPNPFNPVTKISWQSPVSGHQSLKVYDVLGNEVATLVDEYKTAGSYEVEFDGSGKTSGVYFYQLRAGSYIETRKMILIK